jgi:hypothetical protein
MFWRDPSHNDRRYISERRKPRGVNYTCFCDYLRLEFQLDQVTFGREFWISASIAEDRPDKYHSDCNVISNKLEKKLGSEVVEANKDSFYSARGNFSLITF